MLCINCSTPFTPSEERHLCCSRECWESYKLTSPRFNPALMSKAKPTFVYWLKWLDGFTYYRLRNDPELRRKLLFLYWCSKVRILDNDVF